MILFGKNEIYNILIPLCYVLAKLWTTNTAKKGGVKKHPSRQGGEDRTV